MKQQIITCGRAGLRFYSRGVVSETRELAGSDNYVCGTCTRSDQVKLSVSQQASLRLLWLHVSSSCVPAPIRFWRDLAQAVQNIHGKLLHNLLYVVITLVRFSLALASFVLPIEQRAEGCWPGKEHGLT